MGLYDRDYTQQANDPRSRFAPGSSFGMTPLSPAVKTLLLLNIAVYLVNVLVPVRIAEGLTILQQLLIVYPATWLQIAEIWRLITYQFVHWNFNHIFFNMLALFFLGPPLERLWGTKKFVVFYLVCGAAGGVFYTILAWLGFLPIAPMAGASGAILAVLTACAILFPHFIVFFFFFPLPIRVFAMLLILYSVLTILSKGVNAGGEAAHFAGIAAGAFYVFSESWRTALKLRFKSGRWEKSVESERRLRIEVDRILKKVYDSGLQSLTSGEKRILKKATRLEQMRQRR